MGQAVDALGAVRLSSNPDLRWFDRLTLRASSMWWGASVDSLRYGRDEFEWEELTAAAIKYIVEAGCSPQMASPSTWRWLMRSMRRRTISKAGGWGSRHLAR